MFLELCMSRYVCQQKGQKKLHASTTAKFVERELKGFETKESFGFPMLFENKKNSTASKNEGK